MPGRRARSSLKARRSAINAPGLASTGWPCRPSMAYASPVDSFWCLSVLTSASCAPHRRPVEQPKESRFSPYQNNGGTCLAIAGKDFCIVAADSRLSTGYSILSRTSPKVSKLTSKCCIASSGCQADMITLQKHLKFRLQVSVSKLSE